MKQLINEPLLTYPGTCTDYGWLRFSACWCLGLEHLSFLLWGQSCEKKYLVQRILVFINKKKNAGRIRQCLEEQHAVVARVQVRGSVSYLSHMDLSGLHTFMHLSMTLRQPAYTLPCLTSTSHHRLPVAPLVYCLSWLLSFDLSNTLHPYLFPDSTAADPLFLFPFMAPSLGLALGIISLILTYGFPCQLGWILCFFFFFFLNALRNTHILMRVIPFN